ncbi:NAD(P)H-hydrate dehydratase [Asaia bogorensis]|uniref:NAD(P)H-hydrate dehydratase n=1 Tax=Asaia bogorensis TaxID=91915 RepID=UPI000EFC642F|nr:NAD(P)H-hydrate dehydratase [Asaia bogorensis]
MTALPLRFCLPDPAQCAAMDDMASHSIGIEALMERAGWAVAQAVKTRFAPCRVLVLCGPGNNGGDGYVAARYLERAGWPVQVAALAAPRAGTVAAQAAARFHGRHVAFDRESAARADLVVDAVFGAGLDRAPSDDVMTVLASAKKLVAIDLPSFVNGRTGELLVSEDASRDVPDYLMSVTFVRPKPGHVLYPARSICGEVICADIGMPEDCVAHAAPDMWLNHPALWAIPAMSPDDHKYSRGVVSLCGGAVMPGATRLAAAGARASGAGLVRISAGKAAQAYRLGAPGLVVDDAPLPALLEDERREVWLCGPGLTPEEVEAALPSLLRAGRIVLADAGALGWADGVPEKLRGVSVITPHIGEFTKLFGAPGSDLAGAARAAAEKLDCVVLLKGAVSIIAAPDGRVMLNDHASPALATAGSGDTLAGVIATMLAAGMPAWEASCAGAWLHGEAGMKAGNWPVVEALDTHLGDARALAIALHAAAHGQV